MLSRTQELKANTKARGGATFFWRDNLFAGMWVIELAWLLFEVSYNLKFLEIMLNSLVFAHKKEN